MKEPHFSPHYEREMEERFTLEKRAIELLDIISAEFQSDPTSVQCFDLRIAQEAIQVSARLKKLKPSWEI